MLIQIVNFLEKLLQRFVRLALANEHRNVFIGIFNRILPAVAIGSITWCIYRGVIA